LGVSDFGAALGSVGTCKPEASASKAVWQLYRKKERRGRRFPCGDLSLGRAWRELGLIWRWEPKRCWRSRFKIHRARIIWFAWTSWDGRV